MCLGCHGLEGFAPPVTPGEKQFPMVLKDRFLGSAHGKLNCVECHTNVTKIPHDPVTVQVSCVTCHESKLEEAKDKNDAGRIAKLSGVIDMIGRYMKSIHAQPSKVDQSHTNATCYNCHDAHYVYPPDTPNYNWWRLNLPYACGSCHTAELAEYEGGDLLGLPHHARHPGSVPRQDATLDHQKLRQLPQGTAGVVPGHVSWPGQHTRLRLHR
jgi:hypothetical protein